MAVAGLMACLTINSIYCFPPLSLPSPSRPIIINITVTNGEVLLQLHAETSGTTGTFTFVVIATNVDDSTSRTYNFAYDNYVDGSTVDAVIESITDGTGGRYTFTVMSRNEFGSSTAVVSGIVTTSKGLHTLHTSSRDFL